MAVRNQDRTPIRIDISHTHDEVTISCRNLSMHNSVYSTGPLDRLSQRSRSKGAHCTIGIFILKRSGVTRTCTITYQTGALVRPD